MPARGAAVEPETVTMTGAARSWPMVVDTPPVLLVCTMVTRFASLVGDPPSLFRSIICSVELAGSLANTCQGQEKRTSVRDEFSAILTRQNDISRLHGGRCTHLLH